MEVAAAALEVDVAAGYRAHIGRGVGDALGWESMGCPQWGRAHCVHI